MRISRLRNGIEAEFDIMRVKWPRVRITIVVEMHEDASVEHVVEQPSQRSNLSSIVVLVRSRNGTTIESSLDCDGVCEDMSKVVVH